MTASGAVRIVGITRSIVLHDGRRVHLSGDAAILRFAKPLPYGVSPAAVGRGHGDRFTIAGYGTTEERVRGAFGSLHETTLAEANSRARVDANWSGAIGVSACFGDSRGPVMRGGELVGVITRASYLRKPLACGYYTRWAPIRVYGRAPTTEATTDDSVAHRPLHRYQRHHAARDRQVEQSFEVGLFGILFTADSKKR